MNQMVFIFDEEETAIPEAARWQSGLAACAKSGAMGIGFVLMDQSGCPLMGVRMSPGQAIEQAEYLLRVSLQILRHTAPLKAEEVAQRTLREAVQLPRDVVAIRILREALAELEGSDDSAEGDVRGTPTLN